MGNVIAIGALGGSGTRAIAQVFIDAGIYMGDDLNIPNDNLIFTRLFKNPKWYESANQSDFEKRLLVFEQYMKNDRLSIKSIRELIYASRNNPTFPSKKIFYRKILLKTISKTKNRKTWGWKEPNTQIFIDEISHFFSNLKYIHVLRNGLDMAFSNNMQQLNNWGNKFGITINGKETKEEIAVKQLNYWIESTKEVISKSKILGDNFLLINHTEFCLYPKVYVDKIIEFTGLAVPENKLDKLYLIPKITTSNNRYKNFDLSIFKDYQLNFVKEMGFEI